MFRFRLAFQILLLAGISAGAEPLLANGEAPHGFPIVETFSARDINANPEGWTVVQDRSGVLYFGCRELLTFDGDRWRSIPIPDSYVIRGLAFSEDESRLWAAAIGEIGWFERTTTGGWIFHSLKQHLPPEHRRLGEVWHVFPEGEGAVFVSDERIVRWDGAGITVWHLPGTRHLRGFVLEGRIYVQHQSTGLYRMDANGPELVLPAAVIGRRDFYWLERRGPNWFGITNQGKFFFSNREASPVDDEASSHIRAHSPTHVARMPDGRLAIATVRGGILLLGQNGEFDGSIAEREGLPTRLVTSLFVDRDKQLWATSFTHISRIAVLSSSTLFDLRSGLPDKPFHQVVAKGGQLLAAADDTIHEWNQDSARFQPSSALNQTFFDLKLQGDAILAAGHRSVLKFEGHAATALYSTEFDAFAVEPLPDGGVLVADGRRITEIDPLGRPRVVINDLPDNAWSMAKDARGRIWLGTETYGILVARATEEAAVEATAASTIAGLPDLAGKGIVRSRDANRVALLWNGAARLIHVSDPVRVIGVTGYPARTLVAASEFGDDGMLWTIHTGRGLAPVVGVIDFEAETPRWRPHFVEGLAAIGPSKSLFRQVTETGRTILWIGGTNGILRHEVTAGVSAPQPRPPLLRVVARSSDDDVPQAITGPLPYNTRGITFEFAQPDFRNRASLRLETRISGVDRDWVPADSSSRRELSAVRDGRYMFEVRALAETGVASEPARFSFEVLPPWWRTTPAILGAALALVPLGYGFYRLRVRSLRRRNAELERKVRQRTEELERASAAKTEFVANMSHDIRNPLNGIVGLTLALEETKLERRQREIVATLRECTTYLSTLVDDVLDFASIEAGRVELRPGPFVPHELLRSIVTTLKGETAERGALLLVEADPALPASIIGDAGRVQQILVNYVSNALKYAGGHIRLAAAIPEDSPGEIEFSVTDEGPGISEQEKATLFTKFTRLSRARRDDIPGAGLGLAACRLLADIMGGSVGVESEPGHGARFYLRLPLTIATSMPSTAAATPDLPNTTVLVVEDADYNALAASAVLARLGLSCERARTGAEALRLFRERRFNVVLLDRNLPDIDGTEVARQMRAMESDGLQSVLLAVTAYCTAQDRELCLKAGMDAFVGKPLTPEKLRRVLLATGRRQLAAASVHVPPGIAGPTLDLSLLRYLANGNNAGIDAEIDRYLVRLAECEAEIAAAESAGDLEALARAAHALDGHAKLIGAAGLAELAVRLEQTARSGDAAAARNCRRGLDAALQSVRAELRHFRPSGLPA